MNSIEFLYSETRSKSESQRLGERVTMATLGMFESDSETSSDYSDDYSSVDSPLNDVPAQDMGPTKKWDAFQVNLHKILFITFFHLQYFKYKSKR